MDFNFPKNTSEPNPWKVKSSTEIYENAWIKVREDKVITPGGSDGIYGKVSFKNKAIGIIPLDTDGYTFLVGQYRYPLDEYCWEIPMGGGPVGEDILETAKRELKEETGFIAEKWEIISRIHTSNSVTDEEGFVFVAEGLTQAETEFEDTEDLTIIKVHLKDAIEMIMNNEITDAISIVGLLKLARLKGV